MTVSIFQGCAGPSADLEGTVLTAEQREKCKGGLDERQLRMLKAQASSQPAIYVLALSAARLIAEPTMKFLLCEV